MSGHPLLDGKAFDSSMVGVIGRVFDCAWSEIANQRGPRHRKAEDRSPTGFGAYLPLPLAAGLAITRCTSCLRQRLEVWGSRYSSPVTLDSAARRKR
jgi:hypothetical protein